ncbi:MAG: hypothetical protein JWN62_486 [Acidimicrobiales bacterium]|nr:hypothetical protein [Acidimicrobiales bacterium]
MLLNLGRERQKPPDWAAGSARRFDVRYGISMMATCEVPDTLDIVPVHPANVNHGPLAGQLAGEQTPGVL